MLRQNTFDRLVRNPSGSWKVLSRVAVYEWDRIDPVGPSVLSWLINRLADYRKHPRELRHLADGLERKGSQLVPDIVVSGSARERALKSDAVAWLGGGQEAALSATAGQSSTRDLHCFAALAAEREQPEQNVPEPVKEGDPPR